MLLKKKDLYCKAVFLPYSEGYVVFPMLHRSETFRLAGFSCLFSMWLRAVWREGRREEEGVIPETWLISNKVYWPPGTSAHKALEEQHAPTPKWRSFDLIKVKLRSGKTSLPVLTYLPYVFGYLIY